MSCSGRCCLSSSLRKPIVPAPNPLPPGNPTLFPHSHWFPRQQAGQFEPRVFLRFSSFKSLVWSESSQIQLVESSSGFCHHWQRGKWLRQWSMQCLIGPACGGFGGYWVWRSRCPRGAQRRARGCNILSAKLIADSFGLKRIRDICIWPQT